MMRRSALPGTPAILAGILTVLLVGAAAAAYSLQQDTFPHRRHAGLFPVCQGCHAGIETGEADRAFPSPDRCAACHDGTRVREVSWSGPGERPSNLRFTHTDHLGRATDAGGEATCQTCHQQPGASGRMDVSPATPDRCATCHAHDSLDHPNGGQACSLCHRPLTDAPDLPAARIAGFPRPSSHEATDFLSSHGPDVETARATCATCHARPSCERCHVNAEALPAIQALAPDPRVRSLVAGLEPEYPTPSSHDGAWIQGHGRIAGTDPAECANCHTRPSCLACHENGGPALAALPLPRPGGPGGVEIDATRARARLHPPDFARGHGSEAATRGEDCASCHAEAFCSSCHAGAETPSFHPMNFLETHASRAFGDDSDCVTCHNPELFCRSCHAGMGLTPSGRLNAGFHDAQPFWLLGHGQAARQDLTGCVTCHRQTDCTSCHSPLSGWGVSPHGPGFEPSRFRESATTGCILCHLGGIPGGGIPDGEIPDG